MPSLSAPKNFWSSKTVLVTGGGGFIGSHLVERLVSAGARTKALVEYNSFNSWGWLDQSKVKDEIQVFLGDVRDIDSLREAARNVDIVFHLAALIAIPYSYQTPLSYIRTNVEGTLNMLQASRDAGVGLFVHTSTSEVYGTAQYVPIDERHPLQGQSPYAASKIGADKIVEAYQRSYDLPTVTVRPFNTFGPRQSARAIIPTIISQAMASPILRLGNLKPSRDLLYVLDTVEGFIKAAEARQAIGQVINLGTGKDISIGDLAQTILKVLGKKLPIEQEKSRLRPDLSEVERLCADVSKAQKLLEWQSRYSLEDGIRETADWMEKNLDRFRVGAYAI